MLLNNAASPRMGVAWHVEMLGGLRAVPQGVGEDGKSEPVEQFRTHKTALLFARLALFPDRTHARDELADLLWPDAPADRGRANLTQTLVYLRQALREPRTCGLFVSDHKTVRVAKGLLQTDVAQWQTAAAQALAASASPDQAKLLQSALAAYRGTLLPGLYDDWVCDERDRLAEIHDALQTRLQTLHATSPPVHPALPAALAVSAAAAHAPPSIRNAPLRLTRFFGREGEITGAVRILSQGTEDPPVRLLSLLGTGGIGKTRLALEIAHAAVPAAFGWAAFVPLVDARTSAHMESILLQALGLGVSSGESEALKAAIENLNDRAAHTEGRLLLVLDNLEQLGEAAAPVVTQLLGGVPALTLLATSRQPVGIAGEQEIALGPLPGASGASKEMVPDALRLFVDRARLVCPGFALTPENEPDVTHLCSLLEGVPLALELAAAWVRVLTPVQIAARLHNRFDLLSLRGTSRSDGVPKRHQSLHAAIAWSYDLLGPSLQTFFAQLSVFRGGWTADAAQAVTGIKDVSEPLLLLTERSLILVEAEENTGETRFRMLESLREFAHEQACGMDKNSNSALRARHARYFDDLSRKADKMVQTGQGIRPAMTLLGAERDNLRAVFAWLKEQIAKPTLAGEQDQTSAAGVQAAIQCIVQCQWLWPVKEMYPYLCLAAEAADLLPGGLRSSVRAGVLSRHGIHSLQMGEYEAAECQLREALDLWERVGDRDQLFETKKRLASLMSQTERRTEAADLWQECLRFARETENPYLEAGILNNLANSGSDLAQRRAWIEQAVLLDRRYSPGSYFLACSLNSMGEIAFEQKDWNAALVCLEEAHEVAVTDGAVGMIGVAKMSLAQLLYETGESFDRAEKLLCDAQILFEEQGEIPRIAQVLYLRFGLAIARRNADQALLHASQYLSFSRRNRRDDTWLLQAQGDLRDRLRTVGFGACAEQLSILPAPT